MEAKGIRVYWINSGGTIGTDDAVRVNKGRVEFADGGWNPVESTFLTERQARKSAGLAMPVPKLEKVAIRVVRDAKVIIARLEDALPESR